MLGSRRVAILSRTGRHRPTGSRETAVKHVVTTIDIDVPVEDVFAFMTDLDNAPLWSVGLVEVRHNGPLAEGATGTDVRVMGGKQVEMPWRITSFDRPSVVAMAYQKPFPMTAEFTFEPTGAGTRMTCTTTLRPTGAYRLLGPAIAREARKTDEEQFAKAKHLLESRYADRSDPRAESGR